MAKKLFRSEKNKMIGGVCAGLAEYFDIDSSLVRLIFVALTMITAILPMLVFYIIAWIVIPLSEETPTSSKRSVKK
jgi:phage shock protein C